MSNSSRRWIECHLRVEDTDALLAVCVGPLLRRLQASEDVGRAYFLRDEAGVHVRVERLSDEAAWVAEELHAMTQRPIEGRTIEARIDERPVFDELDGLWCGPAASDLRDDFFSQTNAFALGCVPRRAGGTSARLRLGFDLMVANAAALDTLVTDRGEVGSPRAFLSYRSHADGFFIMSREPEAAKRVFDARCRAAEGWSVARLSALLGKLPDQDSLFSPASAWHGIVRLWFPRVRTLLGERTLWLPVGEDAYLGDYHDITVSTFHGIIQNDPAYRRQMREDPDFHCVRVLLSLFYWTLRNLGLRLIERFFLCHLTSLAFERRFGLDPADALARR